jgi:hypothetical protein
MADYTPLSDIVELPAPSGDTFVSYVSQGMTPEQLRGGVVSLSAPETSDTSLEIVCTAQTRLITGLWRFPTALVEGKISATQF